MRAGLNVGTPATNFYIDLQLLISIYIAHRTQEGHKLRFCLFEELKIPGASALRHSSGASSKPAPLTPPRKISGNATD